MPDWNPEVLRHGFAGFEQRLEFRRLRKLEVRGHGRRQLQQEPLLV